MSLDRLINLVKKTGDRLVVHDPINEHDIVLMDIDSYEDLLFSAETDRAEMNEAELLDQINRDIAIWRAKRSVDDESYDDESTSDDYFATPSAESTPDSAETFASEESLADDTATLSTPAKPVTPKLRATTVGSPWKSAGQILENRFGTNQAPPETSSENTLEYKENVTPNEWKEEPLSGDEPVFYEEPIG